MTPKPNTKTSTCSKRSPIELASKFLTVSNFLPPCSMVVKFWLWEAWIRSWKRPLEAKETHFWPTKFTLTPTFSMSSIRSFRVTLRWLKKEPSTFRVSQRPTQKSPLWKWQSSQVESASNLNKTSFGRWKRRLCTTAKPLRCTISARKSGPISTQVYQLRATGLAYVNWVSICT